MFNGKIERCEWVGHGQEWSGWNQRAYSFASNTTRAEAWERVLYVEDPFQTPQSMRSVPPSLIQEVQPADAELALISVDRVPMFVSVPRDRVRQGAIALSWDELKQLDGEIDGKVIRLD